MRRVAREIANWRHSQEMRHLVQHLYGSFCMAVDYVRFRSELQKAVE
jgi:hypothetical protein